MYKGIPYLARRRFSRRVLSARQDDLLICDPQKKMMELQHFLKGFIPTKLIR